MSANTDLAMERNAAMREVERLEGIIANMKARQEHDRLMSSVTDPAANERKNCDYLMGKLAEALKRAEAAELERGSLLETTNALNEENAQLAHQLWYLENPE